VGAAGGDVTAERANVRTVSAADRAALRGLVLAFRDPMGEAEPASETLYASIDRLLADPGTESVLALGGDGAALGYAQLRSVTRSGSAASKRTWTTSS
jgi:hypothetical protein